MSGEPWMKFYPQDWRSDEKLRLCSLAARGLWIEMLAIMHRSERYGHLLIGGRSPTDPQLAVLAGAPSDQVSDLVAELELAGVFSRTSGGVIYSRRMTRDQKRAQTARKNGRKGGNPSLGKERKKTAWDNPQDKPPDKGGDKPQKPEARSQKLESDARARLTGDLAAACTAARMTKPPGDYQRLQRWLDAGASLEHDVLPTIERITAQQIRKGDRPRTFNLFEPDVLAARDARRTEDEADARRYAEIRSRYPGKPLEPCFGGYDETGMVGGIQ